MKVLHWERKRAPAGDGTWVEYEVLGRGMPVLLANGLAGPRDVWTDLVRQQHDRYRFITWNYRGLRRDESNGVAHSAHVARTVAEHARDACAVLDAEGVARCCVVGWSMGVQTALELFSLAPNRVSSLVFLSGGARVTWSEVPAAPTLGRFALRTLRLLRATPRFVSDTLRRSVQSPEAYTWARRVGLIGEQVTADEFALITSGLSQVNVAVYADTLAQLARYDARDVLPRVDVPTLVIAGDRDLFTSRREVERLVSEIRGAEYLPLPGATHYALLDEAERVNLRIEKFWNEHGYRAAATPSA
jgi:pimeloyl-ACP methyl ester carboxylesterase